MSSSSSTSSVNSSSPPATSKFSSLPIMALKEKIVDKISTNRVTLIVGETGCGKSSQVPQFLLEENISPVLCTQPRRFAVVAVAKMVAESRNTELGGEVGYHIGHAKHLSETSKIVFKTAGVLLDELRDKGSNALKYKVIILDEVHERSVESDLLLVCLKQFLMRKSDMRLVLMSATADISRYKEYFKDLGRGERVEVLAIPSSSQITNFQKRVLYLDQVIELLGESSDSELSSSLYHGLAMTDAELKPEVYKLIHRLILHIHGNEPDIEKSILVFLPTYFSLEQQWSLLKPFSESFKIHILHRSVDTERALTAMKICKSHRKVILATNIAESSVTIPKAAFVIDSCRSLEVFWDIFRKRDSAQLIWASKSQAEQRRGRTGRTCDGQVYRLVSSSFYGKLSDYECPAILRLSLRQQILHICCAESRAINDPNVILQKALDPPESEVFQDASNILIQMRAIEKTSPRSRSDPTFYGRLLASFSLSFEASVLVSKFGEIGLLREGILLGILMDTQPLPIIHPFGDEPLFAEYTHRYFGGDDNGLLTGRREVALIANLCAFQFWQRVFKDKLRLEHLEGILKPDDTKATKLLQAKIEEEWCCLHNLVQSSLHHVSEMYEELLNNVHRLRPAFLGKCDGLPTYYSSYDFKHACRLEIQLCEDGATDSSDENNLEQLLESKECLSVPYVDPSQFQDNYVTENLATIIKEMKLQLIENKADYSVSPIEESGSLANSETPVCVYFLNGSCTRGNTCIFSHSLGGKRPACKFFVSLQGCRNGDSCYFSHDVHRQILSRSSTTCMQEDSSASAVPLLQLFPIHPDESILVLDDIEMDFTLNLAKHYPASQIITTSSLSENVRCDSLLTNVKTFCGLQHPYQTIIAGAGETSIPWNEVKCILWFLNPEYYGTNIDDRKQIVQKFFEYLAIRILGDNLMDVQVVLTMNNIRFAQLQVEKLARDCFFFLRESFLHDSSSFGQLFETLDINKPMVVSEAISYVFELCPPSDIQFGDYTSKLHKVLHQY